ncbi:uncharacterized protein ACA1_123860 [Acanthamoeba castellanii str. Neff]|uniref:Zn(2)-C6 fungal-type domain-containing protein n=1 Tax=Acanthamoeba castellanii (strain ATCC 30010 / Neff) TaxID=1257118 RepID=L8HF39_ACACF|nr:uncharacterized protein ACA1_123860 [Acanthamoeba castellanii str. Neff]ELR23867.1 hypothetical protein ACA1_123860 [Acanthamoeba castellanii str. Neff]
MDDPETTPTVEDGEEEEEEEVLLAEDDSKDPDKKGIARSCNLCRQSHTACETTRPCKRCVRIGKAQLCADIPLRKRGRPKTSRKAPDDPDRAARAGRPTFLPIEPKRPIPLLVAHPGTATGALHTAQPPPLPIPVLRPLAAGPLLAIRPGLQRFTTTATAQASTRSMGNCCDYPRTTPHGPIPIRSSAHHPGFVYPRLKWSQVMADYEPEPENGAELASATRNKRRRTEEAWRRQGDGLEPLQHQHWDRGTHHPQWDETTRLAMMSSSLPAPRPPLDEGWRMPPRLCTPTSLFGFYSSAPSWKDIYQTFPFLNEFQLPSDFAVDDLRKPIAVVARSTEGFPPVMVWVNRSFCTIHGYSYAELLGAPIMKISLMLTYPEIAQGLFNFLKTPKCVPLGPGGTLQWPIRLLLRHRHKQLRAIMMECRVQFCYGSDGFPKYGIYCVDRWREDALKEQELETEKWIFSFQEAAQQQRLLDSVSEQAAVAPPLPEHYIP